MEFTIDEVLIDLKYVLDDKIVPPQEVMPIRYSCARKLARHMLMSQSLPFMIWNLYRRFPLENFYIRNNPNGIKSAARVFAIDDCSLTGTSPDELLWTCGNRVLNDEGRKMLNSQAICENIFVPVEAKYLERVDRYPEDIEMGIRMFSKTPALYLDPMGYHLALDGFHNHDKKCSGCGKQTCPCHHERDSASTDIKRLSDLIDNMRFD